MPRPLPSPVWLALAVTACGPDPLIAAWHHPFRVTRAQEGIDGGCDPELVDADVTPWAFLAISVGPPDVATLYLCDGPEDCPDEAAGTTWVTKATETELRGEVGSTALLGNLCTASWNGLDVTRDGDRIHLELRSGRLETTTSNPDTCDDTLRDTLGVACDSVLVLDGTRR